MKKGRILAIADTAFCPTGYGNQSEAILTRLVQRGWDVYQLNCNSYDMRKCEPGDEYPIYKGIKIIPNKEIEPLGINGLYGTKESIWEIYEKLKPDIIWTINDFYRVGGLTEFPEEFLNRWVHWLPVDNSRSASAWAHDGLYMGRLKFLIFLSNFGWEQEAKYVPNTIYKDAIYHAIPSDIFKPLYSKKELKRIIGIEDKFVIITVGRHQPRKMIWKTANVVARFLANHPDAVWICKSDPNDPSMAAYPECEKNLVYILQREGAGDGQAVFESRHLSPDQMNELYNTGDIFIHLSGGEGFGIPYVESMLAGVPCILSNNTTSPELTANWKFGLPVRVNGTMSLTQFGGTTYDLADEDDAYMQLEFAYTDWKNGSKWLLNAGKEAREFHKKWCDAENVVDEWEEVLYRIIRYNNKLVWISAFGHGMGYSITSETMIPELEKLGYDIYCHDALGWSPPTLDPHIRDLLEKTKNSSGHENHINAAFYLQESFPLLQGNKKIGWAFAESTKINPKYVPYCNGLNTVITTSDFTLNAMRGCGVTTDIRIVSPWVKTEEYPILERPDRDTFTFLHIGVIQERKNTFQLVEAYSLAFPNPEESKTKLIIKSNHLGRIENFKEIFKNRKDVEWVYTNEKPLSKQEILDMYRDADCYVNISHGEGIGNPEMEALSTGLPVISSNWDGRRVFLDDEVGWMVPVSKLGKALAETRPNEDFGSWALFNNDDIVKIFREARYNKELCRKKGLEGAKRMRDRFTPEKAAKQLDAIFMDYYTPNHDQPDKIMTTSTETCPVGFDENYFTNIHKYNPETFHELVANKIIDATYGLNGNIIDVGCGTGYIMKHLLNHGKNVVGVDISDWAVEHPLPGCEGRIFKGSILDIPYDDKVFDFAIAFSVLEHIPEKDTLQAIKELKRVAKRAYVEIAMILPAYPEERLRTEDPTHINIHNYDWWKDKFAQAGMKIIWYDGCMNMIVEPMEECNV